MFLNGSFVGLTFVPSSAPIFAKIPYNKISLFGLGTFDKVWIRNIVEDVAYYDSINTVLDYQPTFNTDTVFLGEFNDNLSAGNVFSNGEDILSWLVSKRRANETINKLVGEYSTNIDTIYDFRVKKGESYIYQITPKTATKIGQSLLSSEIESQYYGIYLIDEDTGLSINFLAEGSIGTLSAEGDITSYKTTGKYDTVSIGSRNFLKGTISGIVSESLGYCDGIVQSTDFIDTIQDFVTSSSSKLLKTKKGDILKIVTSNFSRTQKQNEIREQIDVISFDFQEIEDVANY